MAFKHTIQVTPEDIDQMGHVNNVVYVRYVQETAEAHWKSIAPAKMQQEVLWVVLRHEIDYKAAAYLEDTLECETCITEGSGVKMPRFVSITNDKGQEIILAKTIWCAIDANTKRPKRISREIYELFG